MALPTAAVLGLLMAAAPVQARPRTGAIVCEFTGGGRFIPVAQLRPDDAPEDELICRVSVSGLSPGAAKVAGELTLVMRDGPPRTVASALLTRKTDDPGTAAHDELVIPPSTWAAAVRWTPDRRPFLQLVMRVLASTPGKKRDSWQLVYEREHKVVGPPRATPRPVGAAARPRQARR